MQQVTVLSTVRDFKLSRSTSDTPSDFEDFGEKGTMTPTRGSVQTESIMTGSGGQVMRKNTFALVLVVEFFNYIKPSIPR